MPPVRLTVIVCGLFQCGTYPKGWLEACISKWYPHAHQLILVEGALRDYHPNLTQMGKLIQTHRLQTSFLTDAKYQKSIFDIVKTSPRCIPPPILFTSWIATDRGHSTDETMDILNTIPDRANKIAIVRQDLRAWLNWEEQYTYAKRYVSRDATHILYVHPLDILPVDRLISFIEEYDTCVHMTFPIQTYVGDETTLYIHLHPQTLVGNWAPHLETHSHHTPSSDISNAIIPPILCHRYSYASIEMANLWSHMGLNKEMTKWIDALQTIHSTPPKGLRRHPHTPYILI